MTIDNISFRLKDVKQVAYYDEAFMFRFFEYGGGCFDINTTKDSYNKNKKILQNHFKEEK